MPSHDKIKNHKQLQIFGSLLHDPCLWHFNRRSVSGAFAVGLICAFIPIPFQMVIAAAIAIVVRVNLPLSVALVWISNPVTMPPLFYGAYKLGALVLGQQPHDFSFELSFNWIATELGLIWQPFLLGCLICGVASAFIAYTSIRFLWGRHIIKEWKNRKKKRCKLD